MPDHSEDANHTVGAPTQSAKGSTTRVIAQSPATEAQLRGGGCTAATAAEKRSHQVCSTGSSKYSLYAKHATVAAQPTMSSK